MKKFIYNDVTKEDIERGFIDLVTKELKRYSICVINSSYDSQNEMVELDVIINDISLTKNDVFNIKKHAKNVAYDLMK